jgi:4-amino-4-deoxy-L-arabinose transferase-like glycosyltransferase
MKTQRGFLSVLIAPFRRLSLLWADEGEEAITAEPSEVRLRRVILTVLMLVVPPLLLFAYLKFRLPGGVAFTDPDALDFAQLGRNLSLGRGFVTYVLRPLALTHGSAAMHQPEVIRGPLYPFVLAIAFGALGANDQIAVLVSGLFYLLTIPIVYLLGARVFDRKVGLLTALIFTFNALCLEYAASGLALSLQIFLTTSLLLVMYNLAAWARDDDGGANRRLPKAQLLLAGALASALYLSDTIFFWVLLVTVVAVTRIMARRRWRATAVFAIPICLLVLPWMARNLALAGDPAFALRSKDLWMDTKNFYPGEVAYRYYPEDLVKGVPLFKAVVQKILFGAGHVVQQFPQVTASWVLAFFLPALLFRFREPATNTLRRTLMFCFLGLLVGMLLFGIYMPLFITLVPAMLIYSVAFLIHLVQQAQLNRTAGALVTTLVVVGVCYPLASDMFLDEKPAALRETRLATSFGQQIGQKDVTLSDRPEIVAWYGDHPAIWIPATDDRIRSVRDQFRDVHWLFLTQGVQNYSQDWQMLFGEFVQWNAATANMTEAEAKRKRLRVTGDDAHPLKQALDGCEAVRTLEKKSDNTFTLPAVVAMLPHSERSKVGETDAPEGPMARGR